MVSMNIMFFHGLKYILVCMGVALSLGGGAGLSAQEGNHVFATDDARGNLSPEDMNGSAGDFGNGAESSREVEPDDALSPSRNGFRLDGKATRDLEPDDGSEGSDRSPSPSNLPVRDSHPHPARY